MIKIDNTTSIPTRARIDAQERMAEAFPKNALPVDTFAKGKSDPIHISPLPNETASAGQPAWSVEHAHIKRPDDVVVRPDPARIRAALDHVRTEYTDWKKHNPKAPEPSDGKYTMGQILNGNLSQDDQCLHLVLMILNQSPCTCDDLMASAPPSSSPSPSAPSAPSAPPAPAAPAAPAQDPLGGLMQMLGPIGQLIGPIASTLGGVLASPFGPLILGGALALLPPPADALAAAAPIIAPVAGLALKGIGSAVSGAPGAAPAAAPGGAPDINGLVNGAAGIANAASTIAPLVGAL